MFEKELLKLQELFDKGLFDKPFYMDKIKSKDNLSTYDRFINIPLTYKKDIRNSEIFDRTATQLGDVYGVFSSSGTTGNKTYYIYSKEDKVVHEEFVRTFYSELGVKKEDLGGVFVPIDTGVMAHTMMWQFTTMGAGYVTCPEPSPVNMAGVLKSVPVTIVATRPNVVSTMALDPELAKIANESTVNKLLLGGGFLSRERRKLIERTWNADCYNMFGMSEMFGPMAGECRQKDGQHYLDNYLMIEILDPKTLQPCAPGEIGVAVYTTLWGKGFPLLRYWTGDLMCITHEKCKCGSNLPRIRYKGRLDDSFYIGDKYIFPEALENILFSHGYYHEYLAVLCRDNTVTVKVEKELNKSGNTEMESQIEDLFGLRTTIDYYMPGELGYHGHGLRFIKEV